MQHKPAIYNALVVDDDELDRLNTIVYAKRFSFLNVVGSAGSAEEALKLLQETAVDVLLLDIDMPGMNGHELRRQLGNTQACIFITAYPDYAVESFELAALDFLVKPLEKERFAAAMSRLQDYLEIKQKAALFEHSLGGDAVFIKDGHNQVKIKLHDIVYLEALKDYTRIVTRQHKYCVLSMLGNLLQEAAFQTFVRIHRSYAVQKHFVSKITAQQVFLNTIALPIGRSYKDSLTQLIS